MKILKILFPLSYRYNTPKRMFLSLLIYIAIYIIGCYIPVSLVSLVSSIYVFVGGGILMVNYILKNKGDRNGTE